MSPSVVCLQETFLKTDDQLNIRDFNTYNYIYSEGQRPSGGSSILVHSSCPQREIKLVTNLQAVAVSVTLDKEITICYVYIPPNFHLETEHLDTLLKQLPSPYILVGDFNGHNILWGCKDNNPKGNIIEDFITKKKENLSNVKIFRAKARRTIKASKRKSWNSYVSNLNHKTTIKITQFHPLKYKTWNKGHIKGRDSKHTWRNVFG